MEAAMLTPYLCALRTGLCNMTTADALERVIFRELLGLSGVGVGMESITLDRCHVCGQLLRTRVMPKNTMAITLFPLYFTM